jgi:hypothetical protein
LKRKRRLVKVIKKLYDHGANVDHDVEGQEEKDDHKETDHQENINQEKTDHRENQDR